MWPSSWPISFIVTPEIPFNIFSSVPLGGALFLSQSFILSALDSLLYVALSQYAVRMQMLDGVSALRPAVDGSLL